eukprot:471710-Prorocentrum_minimum.AAC.1
MGGEGGCGCHLEGGIRKARGWGGLWCARCGGPARAPLACSACPWMPSAPLSPARPPAPACSTGTRQPVSQSVQYWYTSHRSVRVQARQPASKVDP